MELITGVDMPKKSFPKALSKKIEQKKKQRIKENGSMDVLRLVNKPSTKDSKLGKTTNRPSKNDNYGKRLP